jgi:non-homologous end joining protein Ku
MSLIEKMSSADFEPERYADEYRERALAMIEKKS